MRKLEFPVRVIGLSNQGVPLFNFLASIDKFTWGMDKSDNIHYEIELTEFPERFWNFIERDRDSLGRLVDTARNFDAGQALERAGLIIQDL